MGSKSPIRVMTPLHIEIALHYCKSEDPATATYAGSDTGAISRIHREFADAGLLEVAGEDKHWKATDSMHRYVETLCSVPLPIEQPVKHADQISQLEAVLNEGNKRIGEETINTRNHKIAAVMDKYWASTPLAKL